jgi:hypothetical protein
VKDFPIRPAWTPLSIAAMVIGFIIWWPLGLAVLAWILWGDRMQTWWTENRHRMQVRGTTGNEAFEEYRAAELDRLERERRRLEEEAAEFHTFLKELRKARDRDEFDRFKAERRRVDAAKPDESSGPGGGAAGGGLWGF